MNFWHMPRSGSTQDFLLGEKVHSGMPVTLQFATRHTPATQTPTSYFSYFILDYILIQAPALR